MQFFDLKTRLKDFTVFSIEDIEKIDPLFHKQRLSEWQLKGYIKKVRQGYYIFSDLAINEQDLFLIANKIYQPSYISLQMAFSFYNLIPEAVYGITSVTSRKTNNFRTEAGNFIYRHIKPELMFGYDLLKHGTNYYSMAGIEKAVLDYLYLNPQIKSDDDLDGIRLNVSEFKARADRGKLEKYLSLFDNKLLEARVKKFISYIDHAQS